MIHISNLNKTFGSSKGLSHINLHVAPGEMVALIGSSGSGKSTLMRHICGLTAADKGESLVRVDNEIVQKNGCISRDIRRIRAGIGMIFQQFNLVERMSVARNVMLGALARTSLWRSLTGSLPFGPWPAWGSGKRPGSAPVPFPAGSSSVPPSPVLWCSVPACCWLTSPSPRWTLNRPAMSCRPCATSTRRMASPLW